MRDSSSFTPAGKRPIQYPDPYPHAPKKPHVKELLRDWERARDELQLMYNTAVVKSCYMLYDSTFNEELDVNDLYTMLNSRVEGNVRDHVHIMKEAGHWYVDDFFYTSARHIDGNSQHEGDGLPHWHSVAPAIMSIIVSECGKVKLEDAANHNHMPIHLFRWLSLNTHDGELRLSGDKYVSLFADETSYYNRFGFKRIRHPSTQESEQKLLEKAERITKLWATYRSERPEFKTMIAVSISAEDRPINLFGRE